MENEFLRFCLDSQLFQDHKKVVIALSGGLDSMNVFHLLYHYQKELGIQLVLAHVNHGQRPESNQEETILRQVAREKKIPIYVDYYKGTFSEEKARTFRYTFFKKVMVETGCTALVTGHHSDDQTETILMRLIRGGRLRHVSGISLRQPFGSGELIRPLLAFRKEELLTLPHFEDESNQSDHYFRNRVRNHYLPELEGENPQLRHHLRQLANEVDIWRQALSELTKQLNIEDLTIFRQQNQAVQHYLLEEYLEQFPDLQLTKAQFQELLDLLRKNRNKVQYLKSNYELIQEYDHFKIEKISRKADASSLPFLLEWGHSLELGAYRLSFGIPLKGDAIEWLAVSRETPILIRERQEGDTILVHGHQRKLRRWFINEKVPASLRKSAVIIEQEHQILSVLGLVTSDLSKSSKSDIMKDRLYIQKIDR